MGPSTPPRPNLLSRAVEGFRRRFVNFESLVGRQPVGGPGTPSLREWHAPTREAFRQLRTLDRISSQQALDNVVRVAKILKGPEDADLFMKTLWTRELAATAGSGDSYSLPGFSRDEAVAMAAQTQAALDPHLKANPHVAEAVEHVFQTNREIGKDLADRRLIPEEYRQDYLHHQILRHMQEVFGGRGQGEMLPNIERTLRESVGPRGEKMRQPGALKERTGGMVTDINRNFWEVQYAYERAIRADIKLSDGLQEVVRWNDLRLRPKPGFEQARARFIEEGIVPAGYKQYNLRSGFSSLRGRNPAEVLFGENLDATASQMSEAWGIPIDRLNKLMEGLTPEQAPPEAGIAILPDEVIKALQQAVSDRTMIEPNIVSKGINWWKTAVLLKRPIYYNLHNSWGDLNRWVGQYGPKMPFNMENWKWAFDETRNAYTGKPSELWQHAHDKNMVRSGRTGVETSEILGAEQLEHLFPPKGTFDLPRAWNYVKKLLSYLPQATTAREDLMRMYVTKMNLDRVAEGQAPLEGVADIQGLVGNNLRTVKDYRGTPYQIDDAVAHITRQSLFDYSEFTGFENRYLRNGLMPFYSWAKKNFLFWPQLAAKAAQGAIPAGNIGAAAGMAGARAAAVGFSAVVAYSVATRVWNSFIMGDAEEQLPEYARRGNHLILPDVEHFQETGQLRPKVTQDANGNRRVAQIRMTDAADDWLSMTGLDGLAPDLKAVFDGRMSPQEYLTLRGEDAIFKDGVPLPGVARKAKELLGPAVTVPMAAAGYKTFPEISKVEPGIPERLGAMANAAGIGDFPGTDIFTSGPPQKSILDVGAQTGYRKQALNSYPTVLQDQRQALARKEKEIDDTNNEIQRIAAGASSANLTQEERERRVNQLVARRESMIADYRIRARRLVDLSSTYLPQR